jgi:hypothetical protein
MGVVYHTILDAIGVLRARRNGGPGQNGTDVGRAMKPWLAGCVLLIGEPSRDRAENGLSVISGQQDWRGAVKDGAGKDFVPALLAAG